MIPEQRDFMYSPRLPLLCSTQQAAWLTGFHEHEIPILVQARLLTPVGNPGQHDKKMFSTAAIQELPKDWPTKARAAIKRYWQRKNSQRRSPVNA